LIKEELIEIREKYGDERRSVIEYSGGDVSIEDLIADENVVITISCRIYKTYKSNRVQNTK
jgi:DNA gyrase subunit A